MNGLPTVLDGGCAVSNYGLFVMGGYTDLGRKVFNSQAYKLDLRLKIDTRESKIWIPVGELQAKPLGLMPGLLSLNEESDSIYIFGGAKTDNKVMQKFNSTDYSFKDIGEPNDSRKLNSVDTSQLNQATSYSISGSSLVQNDLIPTEYIAYGGNLMIDNKFNKTLSSARVFDSVRNYWVEYNDEGMANADHVAIIYKGTMYVMGGKLNPNGEGNPLKIISTFNIRSSIWSNKTTSGDFPLYDPGLVYTSYENLFFLAGNESSSIIYCLDLDNFVWTKYNIPGFSVSSEGCLAYYNGFLINAFGMNQTKLVTSTQIINTKTWSLEDSINLSTTLSLEYVVLIVCSVLACILLVILFFLYRRKKNNQFDDLELPEVITEPIWCEFDETKSKPDVVFINPYQSYYDDLALKDYIKQGYRNNLSPKYT